MIEVCLIGYLFSIEKYCYTIFLYCFTIKISIQLRAGTARPVLEKHKLQNISVLVVRPAKKYGKRLTIY